MAEWIGVDEAGRGALAGPVVAAAVAWDPDHPIAGIADSKKLTARRRERLLGELEAAGTPFAVGWAAPDEVDRLNVLQATFRAMERAVAALPAGAARLPVRIDGNGAPAGLPGAECWVGGDGRDDGIAAASIVAKVLRDALMVRLDEWFPGYELGGHKGYGTAAHRDALGRLGPSPAHRRSFRSTARLFD
jgi:ribonuclease HII